ncbi:P-type ATPase, partial [Streptosporangium sandarakinum]
GDAVPADCRVVRAVGLEVDEASLTGESQLVARRGVRGRPVRGGFARAAILPGPTDRKPVPPTENRQRADREPAGDRGGPPENRGGPAGDRPRRKAAGADGPGRWIS